MKSSIYHALLLVSILLLELAGCALSFSGGAKCRQTTLSRGSTTLRRISASDLLYQDQQDALLRRADREQELLVQKHGKLRELVAPRLKASAPKGTGFAKKIDPTIHLASQQAKVLKKEGVIRVDGVLSSETADSLRDYVLDQQKIAARETDADASLSQLYYGVENRRKSRCDLQLSLLRGGFAAHLDDEGSDEAHGGSHVLANSLQEILGDNGSLRRLYENLVTEEGELYELAAVITNPGSNRQTVHPDLPYKDVAPLYVVFLALQDVTEDMGPTSFLLRTHTSKASAIFSGTDQEEKERQLVDSNCQLSTLKKGDAVVFDARLLHCGNANTESVRVLFNFSFRNPKVKDDLGYKGSIRPGYEGALSLLDVGNALKAYGQGDENPFAQYI